MAAKEPFEIPVGMRRVCRCFAVSGFFEQR